MSKAARALRRSSVRLRSLGSGHTSINLVISEQSNVRSKLKGCVSAQQSAAKRVQKWSQQEKSPAIQDVLYQHAELDLLWTETQTEFVGALKGYKLSYEHILEMEKKLDQARKQLNANEEKEKKLQKELVKGPKEPAITQEKLRQATDQRRLSELEVASQQKETELYKLMSLKAGLLDLSAAMERLSDKCATLATSQRNLASLIPEANTRMDQLPLYTGNRESTHIVFSARQQLDQAPPTYASAAFRSLPSSVSASSMGAGLTLASAPMLLPKALTTLADTPDYFNDSFESFDSD